MPGPGFAAIGVQPSTVRLSCHGKLAFSDAPGAMLFTKSAAPSWQSFEEKIRSLPLITRKSIWLVPTLTSQATVPPLLTVSVNTGVLPAG